MIESVPSERRPELVCLLAIGEQPAPAVPLRETLHHPGADPAAGRGGGQLDQLDLEALVFGEIGHTCVFRVDAAGVIEFHPRHLGVVLEHLHEPRLVYVVIADIVPPLVVLVADRPVEGRHPQVLVRRPATEVDELQGHAVEPTTGLRHLGNPHLSVRPRR